MQGLKLWIKIYLASKLNHNTLFVLVAVYLEHIDLKLLSSFPQYCSQSKYDNVDSENSNDNDQKDDDNENNDDDGCIGMVRLDPPVCDGYLHWGNCRICYDMLDAHNDDHDDDVNFDNCDDHDGLTLTAGLLP